MHFWRLHQSGLVFLPLAEKMLREAPTQQPKPSSRAWSVPREQTAQALTCLRDFCSHLTLYKLTVPSTGGGSWTGNNAARQCAERHGRRAEEGKEAVGLGSNFSNRWEAFSLFLNVFPLDSQTTFIYQCRKEIDYKRNSQSVKRRSWSHYRISKHARTAWFSTAYSLDLTI